MNELEQRIFSQKIEGEDGPTDQADRRREPRIQVDRLVYVQLADSGDSYFEEVRSMRDLSRSGFYFVTDRDSYKQGIRLHVVPAFGCLNLEYLGEVVRVEELPFGEFGVAVRLLRVEEMVFKARSSTRKTFQALARADSSQISLPESDSEEVPSEVSS